MPDPGATVCNALRRLLSRIRRVAYTEKPGAEVAPGLWRCYPEGRVRQYANKFWAFRTLGGDASE
jgi:hypothetical protein